MRTYTVTDAVFKLPKQDANCPHWLELYHYMYINPLQCDY